ncbi:MAG TPA: helix-turn-helix transcriptional regulator [Ktedonobacteraceae bacterium]|nr:helix-turn-helix transcriptional regulator [Ktedonobacteraceae bacterium]
MNMNTNDVQQLKMAWLAAEETGDRTTQIALLRDHPDAQDELIDFITAYHITELAEPESDALLPLTERAMQTALERVFNGSVVAPDLRSLRARQGMTLVEAARKLHLGADVWKKFEDGVIDLVSLSERQLGRLAQFFHVSAEQFSAMLLNSQPVATINRRQTAQAAHASQQTPQKQSFAEAIAKSAMPKADKKEWL